MSLSKLLVASILASLLLLHLVDAAQSIAMEHVLQGAVYHHVHVFVKELVELVADGATVFHQVLLETKKCVLVMQA
ncbi:hypothetical protein TanjilG_08419 [Lupinus angustifolius]|uniref:Uncharacterized protein n=1 Tax=Lupinus angustifolius TaxID=3871 RepID=A0A394DES6_LUPAN|nr:hypothetical protein TanjilG_08419 [Lupinus angustifolius]